MPGGGLAGYSGTWRPRGSVVVAARKADRGRAGSRVRERGTGSRPFHWEWAGGADLSYCTIPERVIATGVLVRGGQVRCRRSRLGGSDALVDGDSFAQAGAGGGLVAGPSRAAGGAFERPSLIQRAADLTGELQSASVRR